MSLAYFPLYPDDFEADTAHLTLAEDGAFNRLLRLCWRTPGCSVPADRAWVYRRLRAHSEADQLVVETVISEFFREEGGRLSNARLSKEWLAANEAHERRKQAGSKGGKSKALKTNETPPSNAKAKPKQPEPEPEPEPEPIEDTPSKDGVAPTPDGGDPDPDDDADDAKVSLLDRQRTDTAFRQFVAAASRQPGWTVPKALNRQRRIALTARIREHGLDGWGQVIERAERSRFLTGQSDRPFGLTLDWLLKPSNLLKVLEGNYDDRAANSQPTGSGAVRPAGTGGRLDAFDRLDERLAGYASRSDTGRQPDAGPAEDGVINARFTRLTG